MIAPIEVQSFNLSVIALLYEYVLRFNMQKRNTICTKV